MNAVLLFLANAGWSVLAGVITLGCLIWRGKHRDSQGKLIQARVPLSVANGAALYTLIICMIGNWAWGMPISDIIRDGFGDQRMAWLMLAPTKIISMVKSWPE